MEQTLGGGIRFRPGDAAVSAQLVADLKRRAPKRLATLGLRGSRIGKLPFYTDHELIELHLSNVEGIERAFVLYDGKRLTWLDGTSAPIHAVNDLEQLNLTADTLLDYIRFFLYFVHADSGAFALVESPDALEAGSASAKVLASKRALVVPFAPTGSLSNGLPEVAATIAYSGVLFEGIFSAHADGQVEMTEDEPLGPLEGVEAPACPALGPVPVDPPGEPVSAKPSPKASAAKFEELLEKANADGAAAPADRRVTESVVAVLLAEAAGAAMGHTLLQRFNTKSGTKRPLEPLSRFVVEFTPIIIIESEIPFVEQIAVGLLDPEHDDFEPRVTERATALSGDDSACVVNTGSTQTRLHLISFHSYRRLWDAEWTAHHLALGSATVLIGCARAQDVPEALRRVADLTLKLPRIDERPFPAIFQNAFGVALPKGWRNGGRDWVRYLLHSDFHAPIRLKLTPEEAVDYLRERSLARLTQVSAADAPKLADLHGLGEAKRVAEDLIADIAAARAGRIPWSSVDHGLLLVGPPGTGKTTLARAVARACEVKFIHGSAASWQATGSLDVHLRAIRDTFSEARRYAPSILFIDEIDSIGSRELLSGSNAIYQTEVINGVLEQIQGIDPDEPVIVIGATNYADKVDPALRRAGRLDQVINIPRPNVAGLQQIFRYHLALHRKDKQLARDIDERSLAQLAFGLTGADVEFFVRGAARRARKERRKITQADLVAEVTRRPRHPDSVVRLSAEEMRRVAVHEAGHAVAALHDASSQTELTFVSIVPRTDGSLGFTASAPPEGAIMTRAQVLNRLRTVLAGRAAEALVYGPDNISLSAGGGTSSDLAVATRIATSAVCTAGLGGDGSLHWSATATPAQLRQVDRLLSDASRAAEKLLRKQRADLDRLVEALVEKQELDGETVRALLMTASQESDRKPSPKAAARRR